MPIGSQDLWVAGSRLIYQRDPFDAAGDGVLAPQPWVDLGIVETINPALEPTVSKLRDGVSGIRQLFDSKLIRQIERYTITTRNLALRNWNLFLRGRRVETFSQTVGTNISRTCTHRFFPGHVVKIQDEVGGDLYALLNVHGVHTPSAGTATVTEISNAGAVGTHTITVSQDLSSGAAPLPGSFVILKPEGLAAGTAQANAGTYELLSKSGSGPTILTVRESLASAETGLTGSLVYKSAAAGTNNVSPGPRNLVPAWKVDSLAAGTIYAVMGGSINAEVDLVVVFSVGAVSSGARLIRPQTQVGDVRGRVEVFWNRGGFAEMSVRRCRAIITPDTSQIVVEGDQFSGMTFGLETITDETAADPDGDFLYVKGALPSLT